MALTGDSAFDDRGPRWSPDGKYIAFNRTRASAPQTGDSVWLMTADGGSPRSIVEGSSELWLPDGQAFVYFRAGQLHRYDLASKQSRALTNEPHVMPIAAVSPDGRWLVYQSTAAGNVDLRAVPIDGGPSLVIVATSGEDYHPFFSPSGRWLYFEPNHKNIARVPGPAQEWRTAAPETVTHFPESALSLEDPQVSPDGRQLGFSRIRTRGDVWILTR